MIVIVAFFVLLLLGIPISMVVLGASTLGVILYSGTPLQIVVQQMFSGLNNYVLLAIPLLFPEPLPPGALLPNICARS